jgi:hypothetical protein
MTWRLLDMAIIANRNLKKDKKKNFKIGKILQATYFADVTLPHTLATMNNALRKGREIVEIPEEAF